MGGSGSGRWGWHDKKTTVEECLILSAGKLARDGIIAQSPGSGWLWWTNTATGERTASAGYSREVDGDLVVLRLRYTVTRRDGETARRRRADRAPDDAIGRRRKTLVVHLPAGREWPSVRSARREAVPAARGHATSAAATATT